MVGPVQTQPLDRILPKQGHAGRGALRLAAGQFCRNRVALAGAICLGLICVAVALAPWLAPYDPAAIALRAKLQAPSFAHLLGTDYFGRDILSRLLYGGRLSLTVGLLVVIFSFMLGVPLGLVSGF